MRCKTCDYPLWNLPARKCPECGTDFKASDFHFVPNSIRFCCPHCTQEYYGTTPEGHLIPRTFSCVRCSQRIDMDEMLLQPAEGIAETQTRADVMPWLERQQRGWFRGLIGTMGMAMVSPQRLMRAVPAEGGTGQAWMFALVCNFLVALGGAVVPLLVVALVLVLNGDPDAFDVLMGAGTSLLVGSVGSLAFIGVWGAMSHVLLKFTGGTKYGIGHTYQAILYSSGTNAVLAVPCIGPYCAGYFAWVWWMVSAILMVMQGQSVRGLRATLCVGAPPIALAVSVVLAYIGLIFFAVSGANTRMAMSGMGGMPGSGYVARPEAASISAALLTYTAAHNGQGPPHAIELVADGSLGASSFAIWQIGHDEANVPVGNITLSDFQFLPPNRMKMAAGDAAAALPRDVIAHRLGDVVMTYHGIDTRIAPPMMWLAIICPDPDQQAALMPGMPQSPASPPRGGAMPASPTLIAIGIDGSTTVLQPPPNHMQDVAAQNVLRVAAGLPPLPDPLTITHARPVGRSP